MSVFGLFKLFSTPTWTSTSSLSGNTGTVQLFSREDHFVMGEECKRRRDLHIRLWCFENSSMEFVCVSAFSLNVCMLRNEVILTALTFSGSLVYNKHGGFFFIRLLLVFYSLTGPVLASRNYTLRGKRY